MKRKIKDNTIDKRNKSKKWFKDNLQTIRALSGLTLAEISFNTGISVQTLSLIENGRDLSDYQYIVIRQYIESYLTDSLKYSNELLTDDDELSEILIKPVLAICISIICNDMNIWSKQERSFIVEQWTLLRENVLSKDTAPTAKTYSKVFYEEFKKIKIAHLIEAINSTVSNVQSVNNSDNESYTFDYLYSFKNYEPLSPIERITLFICIEVFLILFFATPIDEVIKKSHIKITKDAFAYYQEHALDLTNKYLASYALANDIKNRISSIDSSSEENPISQISLNEINSIIDSLKKNADNMICDISNFIELDSGNKKDLSTVDKLELVLKDWLNLARTAILELSTINNWYFAFTYKGMEYLSFQNEGSSFIDYILSIYEERCELNIDTIKQLLIKERIIEEKEIL